MSVQFTKGMNLTKGALCEYVMMIFHLKKTGGGGSFMHLILCSRAICFKIETPIFIELQSNFS